MAAYRYDVTTSYLAGFYNCRLSPRYFLPLSRQPPVQVLGVYLVVFFTSAATAAESLKHGWRAGSREIPRHANILLL